MQAQKELQDKMKANFHQDAETRKSTPQARDSDKKHATLPGSLSVEPSQADNDLWGEGSTAFVDAPPGYRMEMDDDFEPVPYQTLIRGAPIAVNDYPQPTHPNNRTLSSKRSYVTDRVEVLPNHAPPCPTSRGLAGPQTEMVVGPDSWQMGVINRMVCFVETASIESASFIDRKESRYLASCLKAIVAKCTEHHLNGITRYHNLPGVIFEEAVDMIGGKTFLTIFRAVTLENETPPESLTARAPDTTPKEGVTFLQLAVGYGILLGKRANEGELGNKSHELLAKEGARELLAMSAADRKDMWESHIRSRED